MNPFILALLENGLAFLGLPSALAVKPQIWFVPLAQLGGPVELARAARLSSA